MARSAMNEDKSARYHRAPRLVSDAALAWTSALLAGRLGTGASAWLRDRAAALGGSHPVTVALTIIALGLLHEPVSFLLDWYRGHVVEHRYGLSRQTFGQ